MISIIVPFNDTRLLFIMTGFNDEPVMYERRDSQITQLLWAVHYICLNGNSDAENTLKYVIFYQK